MNKTMTLAQFEAFVNRPDWHRERYHEEVGSTALVSFSPEGDYIETPAVYGWARCESILDDVTISYTETYSHDGGGADTLTSTTSGQPDVWFIWGVTVLDEDGDPLDEWELEEYLPPAFSHIEYYDFDL